MSLVCSRRATVSGARSSLTRRTNTPRVASAPLFNSGSLFRPNPVRVIAPRLPITRPPVSGFHTTARILTWRTKMRPDLKDEKAWEWPDSEPRKKQRLKENLMWWQRVPTDALIAKLKHDLDNSGGTRPGIFRIFIHKAYKPEHIRVLLQALSWLQARFDKDVDPLDIRLLAKAVDRAQAPEVWIEALNMPWLRIWPTVEDFNIVFKTVVKMAEDVAFKTEPLDPYNPDKGCIPIDSIPGYTPPEEAEGEAEAEASEKKRQIDPATRVRVVFNRLIKVFEDPRLELFPNEYTYRCWMRVHAALGEVDKCLALRKKLESLNATSLEDETITLGYLVAGDVAKAAEYWQANPPRPRKVLPTFKDGTLSRRQLRVQLALHLAQGNDEAAYDLIKRYPQVPEMFQSHLGVPERATKLKELYQRAVDEGLELKKKYREYITRFDTRIHAETANTEAANAEAEAEAEAQ